MYFLQHDPMGCIQRPHTCEVTYQFVENYQMQEDRRGRKVNMKKTKIKISGLGLDLLEKASGISGRLIANPDYVCPICLGVAQQIDGRQVQQVNVNGCKVDVEHNFCYLSDMLCAGGG